MLSYGVFLRSEFRHDFPYKKLCSIRLYLQLFVGGFMSCLRYLYLFTYDTLCFVVFCFSSMLPVSLKCPFVIALSVFSDVYFILNLLEVSVMIFNLKSNVL